MELLFNKKISASQVTSELYDEKRIKLSKKNSQTHLFPFEVPKNLSFHFIYFSFLLVCISINQSINHREMLILLGICGRFSIVNQSASSISR